MSNSVNSPSANTAAAVTRKGPTTAVQCPDVAWLHVVVIPKLFSCGDQTIRKQCHPRQPGVHWLIRGLHKDKDWRDVSLWRGTACMIEKAPHTSACKGVNDEDRVIV